MRFVRIFPLLLTVALTLVNANPASAQIANNQARLANAVAVIVNDAIITYADIQRTIGPAMEIIARQYGNNREVLEAKFAEARQSGTDDLIIRRLVLDDFKKAGYNLPETIIEDEIRNRIRERFGDRRTLTKTLQAQGMTYETFRTQVREDFVVAAMRNAKVSSSIVISPTRIENYYVSHTEEFREEARVKLRMIVVNENLNLPGASKKLLEEIRGKVAGGASFAEMASLYSEGSQRAEGGDWGWIERKTLRDELARIAFALKPGEMSDVIATPAAAYLMLVEASKPSLVKPLSEVRDEIERKLTQDERTRQQKTYIDRLRETAFIRYF
jgi:peptidyl-prolyl cis-trans isomerase SurA